jgi:hypothetical protein
MPSNLIKKDAREGKGSKKSLEKKWDRAKDIAKKSDADEPWALTTHIYKNIRDAKASVLDQVELNAAQRLLSVEESSYTD